MLFRQPEPLLTAPCLFSRLQNKSFNSLRGKFAFQIVGIENRLAGLMWPMFAYIQHEIYLTLVIYLKSFKIFKVHTPLSIQLDISVLDYVSPLGYLSWHARLGSFGIATNHNNAHSK